MTGGGPRAAGGGRRVTGSGVVALPVPIPLPAAGRPIPDDGRRAAGGGTRVTGSRVGVVALPTPILLPAAGCRCPWRCSPSLVTATCRLRRGGSLRGPSLTLGAAFGMTWVGHGNVLGASCPPARSVPRSSTHLW